MRKNMKKEMWRSKDLEIDKKILKLKVRKIISK